MRDRLVRPLIRRLAALAPALLALAACASLAGAAAGAGLRMLDPASLSPGLFDDPRPPAPGAMPGARMAPGAGDVAAAWYDGPTQRYRHGVFGAKVEASILVARTPDDAELRLTLPEDQVFEDRAPRLADLDGDGLTEIIAIRSGLRGGAAVAVYGLRGGALREMAATPEIGRPSRWLNIAGIARYTGGPNPEIAYVQTPHIGGVLRLWRYRAGALTEIANLRGFSNHANGTQETRLSATADFTGDGAPDLALPDAGRRALRIVSFAGGKARIVAERPLPARVETAIIHREGRLVMGLHGGAVVEVSP